MNDTDPPLRTKSKIDLPLSVDLPLKIDLPLRQVRACQAWRSALVWWARVHPGQPVDMGILMRRSTLSRSTAYRYLRKARASGLVTADNVPVPRRLDV